MFTVYLPVEMKFRADNKNHLFSWNKDLQPTHVAPMMPPISFYFPALTPIHHSSLSVSLIRHKQQGSQVLIPLGGEMEPGHTVQEVAEGGRATLWCQVRILNSQLQGVC